MNVSQNDKHQKLLYVSRSPNQIAARLWRTQVGNRRDSKLQMAATSASTKKGKVPRYSRIDAQGRGYSPSLAEIIGDKFRAWRERKKSSSAQPAKDDCIVGERTHEEKDDEFWEDALEWPIGE